MIYYRSLKFQRNPLMIVKHSSLLWLHCQNLMAVWIVYSNPQYIYIYSTIFTMYQKVLYMFYLHFCLKKTIFYRTRVRIMVFNSTFNNISVISWLSILLVEEIEVPGENQYLVGSFGSLNVISTNWNNNNWDFCF
jgi:hypothetical protein